MVEEAARANGVSGFAQLSPDDRESVLRQVERSNADLFEALVRHTYDGYYGHPVVVTRLGIDPGERADPGIGPARSRRVRHYMGILADEIMSRFV